MSESSQKDTPLRARTLEIGLNDADQRIDNYLSRILKGVPRSRIYRILRKGEVRVNGGRVRPGHKLGAGDRVRVPPVRVSEPHAVVLPDGLASRLERAVLFEDKRLIVIDKPAGLAVHGGSGLSYGAIEAMRLLRPGPVPLELVHRLDRETSGCLMIARKRSELRSLHDLLRRGKIDKRYFALLSGRLPEDKVVCRAPLEIRRRGGERHAMVTGQGKRAHSEFRLLQRYRNATLVEVVLHTGRTHQIRAHAAHLGNPVIGDERYGDPGANARAASRGLQRLFLHAHALRFLRPFDDDDFHVSAPLSPALREYLDRLS